MELHMAMNAVSLNIDGQRVSLGLQQACERLDSTERELILDFSSVGHIDSSGLKSLEELADLAENKAIKIVLRGVNVDLYKVFKLVKLAPRFSFQT